METSAGTRLNTLLSGPAAAPATETAQLYHWLSRALAGLRWTTLALLLLITLVMPTKTLIGLPNWTLVLAFAAHSLGYALLGHVLHGRISPARILAFGAILDLLSATLFYFLAGVPGGPLFVLFFFAVDYAAASLRVQGTLLYIATVAVVVVVCDLALYLSAPSTSDLYMIFVRLMMISLLGTGMAILTRRLVMEQQIASSALGEAERLAQVNEVRTYFISSVSHDLNTPLTAARAGLSMIEASAQSRLEIDEQRLLSNARRNIERLSIMLDDLLTFNKIEAGVLKLDREQIDLRQVVMDSLTATYPLFLQKNQTLEIDLPTPLPLMGDERQLEQVVVNLLANEHRHTPAGTRIRLSGRSTHEEVTLSINDSGPGIPNEELETIFQRFYRTTSDSGGGSGLGLAIAKAVVELHGGKIWATSAPGQGAGFNIVLPCKAVGD